MSEDRGLYADGAMSSLFQLHHSTVIFSVTIRNINLSEECTKNVETARAGVVGGIDGTDTDAHDMLCSREEVVTM